MASKRKALRTGVVKEGTGDAQVELLRAIWLEMKALNGRVDQTNQRIDQTNQQLEQTNRRLDQTNERLDAVRVELKDELDGLRHRVVESEVRLATATAQLSGDVRDLSDLIRAWRAEHREERAELRARVDRLEQRMNEPR